MMIPSRRIAAVLATLLLALPALAQSPATATRFARIANDWNGQPAALQLAVVRYGPELGAADFSIDLISAIHVGDASYYRELNERFRDYDALLYEMILPGDADSADGAHGSSADDAGDGGESVPDLSFISDTQIGMKTALGLSFQLDEIDYSPANFVHADLDTTALLEQMEARQESLYVYFWRLFFASMDEYARDPLGLKDLRVISGLLSGDDDAMKIAIAGEMVDAAHRPDILAGENGSAVIAARNEHAVDVLRDRLAKGDRRIGIFYGVAHMTDFEQRLVNEFDVGVRSTSWVDAWNFASREALDR